MNATQTKNASPLLAALILVMLISITVYSIVVGNTYGWTDLYPIFFQNIRDLNWSGQFNLDFSFYLTLSGLWVMWRSNFSIKSILLGTLMALLGMMAFGIYLLLTLIKVKGDVPKLLLGERQ